MNQHAWVIALMVLSACAPQQTPTLATYTRTEHYEPEKARWLHDHCDLAMAAQTFRGRGNNGDLGNYQQLVGFSSSRYLDTENMILFACDQSPPWPRTDMDWLREMEARGATMMSPAGPDVCNGEGDQMSQFAIVQPGEGSAPGYRDFALYRVQPTVVLTEEMQTRFPRVVPGPRRAFEVTKEVRCSYFAAILTQLRPGGIAQVSNLTALGTSQPPWLQWRVELVRVGGPELREQALGLGAP